MMNPHEIHDRLKALAWMAGCVAVAGVVGWWLSIAHPVVSICGLAGLGFVIAGVVDIRFAVIGLLLFAPVLKLAGAFMPLPLGLTEFNAVMAVVIFIEVGRYAFAHRWSFRLWEPWLGPVLYVQWLVMLVSTVRGYLNFPLLDLTRSQLEIHSQLAVVTSQFVKPVLYMGMFFVAYNYGKNFVTRRLFVTATAVCLMLYTLTMYLQMAGLFPLFSRDAQKAAGGVIGMSNGLGVMLALYSVLFLLSEPYWRRNWRWGLALLTVVQNAVGLAFTRSRTAWALAVLMGFLAALTASRWVVRLVGLGALSLVLVSTPLWAPQAARDWWEHTTMSQLNDPNAVLSGRLSIWQAAREYVTSSPTLFLVGGGKLDFSAKGPDLGLPAGFAAHHQLVQSWVDEGLLGFLVVLALYARISFGLWRTWTKNPGEESGQLARVMLIITMLMLVSGQLLDGRIAAWYWFLLGLVAAAEAERRQAASAPAIPSTTTRRRG